MITSGQPVASRSGLHASDPLEFRVLLLCLLLAFAVLLLDILLIPGRPTLAHAGETQSNETTKSLPRAVVRETSYDFGMVMQGTSVQHSFEIENEGEAPLKIEHVHTSCGCTAAVVDSDTIAPHSKTQLRVTFDTTGFQGQKVKTVRIYTSDLKLPSALLSLQGTVQADVELSSPKLIFGEVRKGETPTLEFKVSTAAGADFKILDISARGELLQVTSQDLKPEGKEKKVTVTLKPEIPIGAFRDRVMVKTTSKNNPLINVPVFAKISGDVSIEPMVVSFGLLDGPLQDSVSQFLKIKSRPGHLVHVTNVSSDLSGIVADVVGKTDDGESTIKVSVRTSVVGVFRANLTLETDSEDEGERKLSVPVYGIVSKKSE